MTAMHCVVTSKSSQVIQSMDTILDTYFLHSSISKHSYVIMMFGVA